MALSNTLQVVPVTTLNSHESREDLEKWWGIVKAQMKTTKDRDYISLSICNMRSVKFGQNELFDYTYRFFYDT